MPFFPPVPPVGLGYGGAAYGWAPYGGGALPRPPVPTTGGYGGQQYGYNSYGSLDITPPRVSSAISLDGFRVEVYFSEEMADNAALVLAANYTFTPTTGAPVTASKVDKGTAGTQGGYTSVVVTHTGTTLGGNFTVAVLNVEDVVGNPILGPPANEAAFLAYGDVTKVTVTPTAGDAATLQFQTSLGGSQDLLTEAVFTPGVEDPSSYDISTTYPVPLTIEDITHPVGVDASKVAFEVQGMTSASYDLTVGPAEAIEYDGDVLPSAATDFLGVEVGTGTSTASVPTGLLLAKAVGDLYGWTFEDTSGKVLPSSSYRLTTVLNAAAATYSPPLYDAAVGSVSFSDGAVQVDITLTKVSGVDVIEVTSGAFTVQVPASWSTGATTFSLLRNQKADIYTVLVNGVPLVSQLSAVFTGVPTINAGARVLLGVTYQVAGFKVASLDVTSSQTVFTTAWNFLHEISGTFTGSVAMTNDRLLTQKGPLVKGWGDATPATEQDVEVRVNGTAVDIARVNPYTGTIFPTIPIPLMPVGSMTVAVDYKWFPAPSFPMLLNTPGLVLNKWDLPRGHTGGVPSPLPAGHQGTSDDSRFPMGVALPPQDRPQPIHIGHRFIGFEKDYSALFNSPNTLVFNRDPHRVSVPGIEDTCEASAATFDGTTTPQQAEDPWQLDGTDSGSVVGNGTYNLVDASSGSYETGTAAVYYREVDLSCPGTATIAGRIQLQSYLTDGVFTGVGLGFHDNFRLYVLGLLVVNDVQHVGLLTNAALPHLEASWEIGPSALATITSTTTFTVPSTSFPQYAEVGTRIQVLSGSQTGIYTIAACGIDEYEGTVTVTLESMTPFPADYTLYGNDTATVVFETPWDTELVSFRLIGTYHEDDEQRSLQAFVGGSLSGEVGTLTGTEVAAYPADTSLLIPTGDEGRVLWGSLSRRATNDAIWSFARYGTLPDALVSTIRGLVVAAEMSQTPEEDANHEWWITNTFGYSEIDSSGDTLLLKSTSASSGTVDLTFGYERLEPAFTRRVFADTDAEFRVESGTLGAGDAIVRVRDDLRDVQLKTILYREPTLPSAGVRRLADIGNTSLSGLLTPVEAGWLASSTNTLATPFVRQQLLTITKADGASGFWESTLSSGLDDTGGRIIEARLAVTSYTADVGGNVGPTWGAHIGTTALAPQDVRITLKASPSRVVLTDSTGVAHGSFPFAWTDGSFHTYRVVADLTAATAVLVIDDVVQGSVSLALFAATTGSTVVRIGAQGAGGVSVAVFDSLSIQAVPDSVLRRTLGVLRGGAADPDTLNGYEIPRTDGTSVPNSDPSATIEQMDWSSYLRVRVHLDQTWGVSIYRPDIPPPPWFTGDFATQITDPTAAWINVEYRRLPRHSDSLGSVAFGALDSQSVTQQRWKQVRYRLYNTPDEDYIAPQGMVFNRANVVHSGEFETDVTPEVVTVASLTTTMVSIRSANMNADRVFSVVVDGTLIPSTGWVFDAESQTVTLSTALPSIRYPVTITFAPAKPVTETYVCSQPFSGSVTKLNEGTPPFETSQVGTSTSQMVFGSKFNDPSDTLNDPDFILNDPYRTVEFTDPDGSLYEDLTFCTVNDGESENMLSIACDGPAPESGLAAMAISGDFVSDQFSVPGGPAGAWGGGSPSIKGTQSQFDQSSILCASGGNFLGGTLGPGSAVMQPNYPGPVTSPPPPGLGMGLNQETRLLLRTVTPYAEDLSIDTSVDDNTPPSSPDATLDPNPDGTPGVNLHGACASRTTDYAADGVSRLGPWGGLDSLSSSLLGGGAQLTGVELILNGGAAIGSPVVTDFQIEAAN
jgi:hypothetical protein